MCYWSSNAKECRSNVERMVLQKIKKKKKKKENEKPVQHGSPVFTVLTGLDRFSGKVNQSIEPDRCHSRFAVQPVNPADPVQFSKHCSNHHQVISSTPFID